MVKFLAILGLVICYIAINLIMWAAVNGMPKDLSLKTLKNMRKVQIFILVFSGIVFIVVARKVLNVP